LFERAEKIQGGEQSPAGTSQGEVERFVESLRAN